MLGLGLAGVLGMLLHATAAVRCDARLGRYGLQHDAPEASLLMP